MTDIMAVCNGIAYYAKSFTFSGGEIQLEFPCLPAELKSHLTVVAHLQNSGSLVSLLLACEVLARKHTGRRKRLVIPYFPYARQDRIMQTNEAFSLKVIAQVINSLNFDEVITYDPHSYVTEALVNNIRVVSQLDIISDFGLNLRQFVDEKKPIMVSPDAGAYKKSSSIAKYLGLEMYVGLKVRDTATGEITHASIVGLTPEIASGRAFLIVDDICDGGRTFIELAALLRGMGASYVALHVTHGIFSKGYYVFKGLIDRIFTTDTFEPAELPVPDQIRLSTTLIPYVLEGDDNAD